MVSDRKVQANRENSRRSIGPASPEGKARVRLNALKSGRFSKELVVAAAGEKQEEFDTLLSMVRNQFQPQGVVSALLVEDFVTTYWRLQRPRRCETAEIRRRCDTARYRRQFEKISEVDSLKSRFIRDHAALCSPAPGLADRAAVSLSLEETRKQLGRKSLGLEFLIGLIEPIERGVEDHGCLSVLAEVLLVAACGVEDEEAKYCVMLSYCQSRDGEIQEG